MFEFISLIILSVLVVIANLFPAILIVLILKVIDSEFNLLGAALLIAFQLFTIIIIIIAFNNWQILYPSISKFLI